MYEAPVPSKKSAPHPSHQRHHQRLLGASSSAKRLKVLPHSEHIKFHNKRNVTGSGEKGRCQNIQDNNSKEN